MNLHPTFWDIYLNSVNFEFQFIIKYFEMRWQTNTNNHDKNIEKIPHKSTRFIYVANQEVHKTGKRSFLWNQMRNWNCDDKMVNLKEKFMS